MTAYTSEHQFDPKEVIGVILATAVLLTIITIIGQWL